VIKLITEHETKQKQSVKIKKKTISTTRQIRRKGQIWKLKKCGLSPFISSLMSEDC